MDYSGGVDTSSGTDTSSAWQHCPGDPAATGVPASTPLNPGDTVYFKGGSTYLLTAQNPTQYWWPNEQQQGGILMNWSGTAANPITYNGSNGWGVGQCIFTDNYTSNGIVAFWSTKGVSNLVFNGFVFGPIGGLATLPADKGSALPPMGGYGIQAESMTNVTVANCYFHDLGLNFEAAPQGGGSFAGTAIGIYDSAGVVVTNCEFTRMNNALEVASYVGTTNLTIEYCYFHNDIVWNIDMPVDGCAGTYRDAIYIHNNLFQNYDVTYANWTGYGSSPHYDGIIDRASPSAAAGGSPCDFIDGPNVDIYNNTFNDTTSINAASTACIFLTGSTSANVYNNLFVDTPSSDAIVYLSMDGYSHSNVMIRIYNNTSYNAYENLFAVTTGDDGSGNSNEAYPYLTWGATQLVDVKNNIVYDAFPNGGSPVQYSIESTNMGTTSSLQINNDDLFHTNGYANYMYWSPSPANVGNWLAFSDLQGFGWETTGQTNDPQFASLAYGSWSVDSIYNDFHLLASSPCIAAGVNFSSLNLPGLNSDKDGNPRPSGMWDLGAYEYNTNYVAPPPPPQGQPAPSSVTLTFSNVVQTCTTKTNIDHAAMTTNTITTCRVRFSLVASNTGTTNSPQFSIVFWPGQGSAFTSSIDPWPVKKKVKALKESKAMSFKLTGKFTGNQSGAYIYATDTNNNVLASTVIPDPQ